jgi:hypothetical protein
MVPSSCIPLHTHLLGFGFSTIIGETGKLAQTVAARLIRQYLYCAVAADRIYDVRLLVAPLQEHQTDISRRGISVTISTFYPSPAL